MSDITVPVGYFGHEYTEEDVRAMVGPGWGGLVTSLFYAVNRKREAGYDIAIAEVKEKFGGLRFYVSQGDTELYDEIDAIERASYFVCETCGLYGRPRKGGWIKTLCDEHAEGREEL